MVRRGIACAFGLFSGRGGALAISRTVGGIGAVCATPTTSTLSSRCCAKLTVCVGVRRYVGTSCSVLGLDSNGVSRKIHATPG